MGAKLGILVAALAVIGAHYSLSSRVSIHDTDAAISASQYQVLARNASVTGFERAKQHLASSFSSTSLSGEVEGIEYTTDIYVAGDRAHITSTTAYPDPRAEEDQEYVLTAEYERSSTSGSGSSVPAYMNFALIANDDLRLSGNAGATHIYSRGAGSSELNASIHTNGDLTVNGKGNERMKGFGTYSGSASGKHRNTKFQPNHNPDGKSSTYQADAIEIPELNIPAMVGEWTPDITLSSTRLSGIQLYPGTKNNPAIVYSPGDLEISGLIEGYVVFLVDGDVTVKGNTTVGLANLLGKDESTVAVYASGDFDMSGGADFWGQVMVNGDFTMGGNAKLYGSATVGATAWMHGTPDIYYREASNTLTKVLEPSSEEVSIELVAYAEF